MTKAMRVLTIPIMQKTHLQKTNVQTLPVLAPFNSEDDYVEPQFDGTNIKILGFNYTFQYKDHLVNIRLSFEDINGNGVISATDEIKEENHYYPFGFKYKGDNNQITGRDHQYGYNDREESTN